MLLTKGTTVAEFVLLKTKCSQARGGLHSNGSKQQPFACCSHALLPLFRQPRPGYMTLLWCKHI